MTSTSSSRPARSSRASCGLGSGPSAADIARLDAELVRRGLARSRGEARDLVRAGLVQVRGETADRPSHPVDDDTDLVVDAAVRRWVGRAARKLVAALDLWGPQGLRVADRRCIDVGASTGGFTQVLLEAGAAHVVAVDVGHGQLVPELAADPRVQDRQGTTVRGLAAEDVGGRAGVVVADLSFISLTLVAAELAGLLDRDGDLVLLVKPQFEVGRRALGRGGVVTDAAQRRAAVHAVLGALSAHELHVRGIARSPITGTNGNREYLVWACPDPSDTMTQAETTAAVAAATDETGGG